MSTHLPSSCFEDHRIPFVEPKSPNWQRLQEICSASEAQSRWANFGPVSEALEVLLHRLMGLPSSRGVVAASSATTALHAVLGIHAVTAGRPLRWAISAFGFYSTAIGPLDAMTRLVDSDKNGMLDLDMLARLSPEDWDGLLVTNIFGLASNLEAYADICHAQQKPMIVDSALGFPLPRFHALGVDEIVSFHHTKPWGFGEGGCAIVATENVARARSFLNFGVGVDPCFRNLATNGKISDIAAAAIIGRLEALPNWAVEYANQRERISRAIADAGLTILGKAPENTIVAHIPVLLDRPTPLGDLPRARFDVGRYYRSLREGFPTASNLFDRMVNIPAHAAMAEISTEELTQFISGLKAL